MYNVHVWWYGNILGDSLSSLKHEVSRLSTLINRLETKVGIAVYFKLTSFRTYSIYIYTLYHLVYSLISMCVHSIAQVIIEHVLIHYISCNLL